jgi:hypothetical protein
LAEARAFLAAQGSVEQRKMIARVEVEKLEFAAVVAEAIVRGDRAKLRAIQAKLDGLRTEAATTRAELQTLGGMEG